MIEEGLNLTPEEALSRSRDMLEKSLEAVERRRNLILEDIANMSQRTGDLTWLHRHQQWVSFDNSKMLGFIESCDKIQKVASVPVFASTATQDLVEIVLDVKKALFVSEGFLHSLESLLKGGLASRKAEMTAVQMQIDELLLLLEYDALLREHRIYRPPMSALSKVQKAEIFCEEREELLRRYGMPPISGYFGYLLEAKETLNQVYGMWNDVERERARLKFLRESSDVCLIEPENHRDLNAQIDEFEAQDRTSLAELYSLLLTPLRQAQTEFMNKPFVRAEEETVLKIVGLIHDAEAHIYQDRGALDFYKRLIESGSLQ
ncbi:hypothetical protein JX265_002396 [Neoarthrinium moseri]|uniref:Uncharacterized protein n=1 Tax=Neoarthrinium moseri TaxID=1658444 RepID=A0A9P9WUC5_9PEZI|nr:hypothetical protein JX265_002396 [Neoarthrinium moseri]